MENLRDIVLAKINTATEINPAEDPIAKHIALAEEAFDMFEIDGTYADEGVRKNVETWWDNKQNLISLFRKHPYWNEEAKAILFMQDEVRPVDVHKAYCEFRRLRNYVNGKIIMQELYRSISYTLQEAIEYYGSPLIKEAFVAMFNNYELPQHVKSKLRVGAKLTKFVNAFYSQVIDANGNVVDATKLTDKDENYPEDRNYDSYDKHYAKFADHLSELTVKKITVLSVNFNDFMTMSNGNSWSSCHFINSNGIFHEDAETSYHGMYKQGCLSYALDNVSFIFYTLPSNYIGNEYWKVQKLNRICCQYENGIIILGKLYPNNETDVADNYRHIIQKIISECEEFSNSWSFTRRQSRIDEFTNTAYNSGHYPDYTCSHQNPVACFHKPFLIDDIEEMPRITIGHEAYCVHCGRTLDSDEHKSLQCHKHRVKRICTHCGIIIENYEEMIMISDEPYCDDCTYWCSYCDMYEVGEYHEVVIDGTTEHTCDFGYANRYIRCDDCGALVLRRRVESINERNVCERCIESNYYWCPRCREYHKTETQCPFDIALNVNIKRFSEINVGDYVVIKSSLIEDEVGIGINTHMTQYYTNRIVKVTDKFGYSYERKFYVSKLDDDNWTWTDKCFVGVITSDVTDEDIGKIANVKGVY